MIVGVLMQSAAAMGIMNLNGYYNSIISSNGYHKCIMNLNGYYNSVIKNSGYDQSDINDNGYYNNNGNHGVRGTSRSWPLAAVTGCAQALGMCIRTDMRWACVTYAPQSS